MAQAASVEHAPTRALPSIARVLLLVVAMTIWADVNDWLAAKYHLGTVSLNVLRTIVDCGGVVWLGCVVWGGSSLRDLGWRFDRLPLLIATGLAQTALVIGAIFALVTLRGGLADARELAQDVAALTVGKHVFYGVLGAKVAFWEETLFRGDLLRALSSRMHAGAAVVLSSVVFALYHFHFSDIAGSIRDIFSLGIVFKLVPGLAFALSTVRLRSLLPGAIAHALLWAIMGDT
jgi:membrane protease YdiL (CAAX protease family)